MIQGAVSENVRVGMEAIQSLGKQMQDAHSACFLLQDFALAEWEQDEGKAAFVLSLKEEMGKVSDLYGAFISLAMFASQDLLDNNEQNFSQDLGLLQKWVEEARSGLETMTAITTRMLEKPERVRLS